MRPSSWIVEYWEVPRQSLGTGAQMSKQKRYIRPKSEKDINKRLTFLSHYFDTSSKFGIGNFMRILRKR